MKMLSVDIDDFPNWIKVREKIFSNFVTDHSGKGCVIDFGFSQISTCFNFAIRNLAKIRRNAENCRIFNRLSSGGDSDKRIRNNERRDQRNGAYLRTKMTSLLNGFQILKRQISTPQSAPKLF